jgi:hypothetical protein
MTQCFAHAPKHETVKYQLHHLTDAFDAQADETVGTLREGAISGIFFVCRGEDLAKYALDGFLRRLQQVHPALNLKGVIAGVLVDRDGTYNVLTLATETIIKLGKLGAQVLKPAFSVEGGAVMVSHMLEAQARRAA